jgi:hypothetical protein
MWVVPVLIYVRAMRVPRLASVVSRKCLVDQGLREVVLVQTAGEFADVGSKTFVRRRPGHKKLKPALVLRFMVERIGWKSCHGRLCTKYLTKTLVNVPPSSGLQSLFSFWVDILSMVGNFEIALSLIVFLQMFDIRVLRCSQGVKSRRVCVILVVEDLPKTVGNLQFLGSLVRGCVEIPQGLLIHRPVVINKNTDTIQNFYV